MIPISPGREGKFLLTFLAHYTIGLVGIGIFWRLQESVDVLEAVKLIGPLIILATAHSILIVEGWPMLAERFLKHRYRAGEADNQKRWEAWLRRKQEAEGKKEPFDEPQPSIAMSAAGTVSKK